MAEVCAKSREGCGRSPVAADLPGRDLRLSFGDNALKSLITPTEGILFFFYYYFIFFNGLQSTVLSDSVAMRLGRVCAHKQRSVFVVLRAPLVTHVHLDPAGCGSRRAARAP